MSQTLIDALHDPALYNHPVDRVEVLETHISWVVLAGDIAYKIKKPVDFGFLDFSTLEKREHYCREELRLNRRLAPSLYLDVIAIGGSAEAPRLGVADHVIEYAVKMKRFDEAMRLDRLLDQNRLHDTHIDSLADELATFHQTAEIAGNDSEFGSPEAVFQPIQENFAQIRPLLNANEHSSELGLLDRIEDWCRQSFGLLQDTLAERKQLGFVRECHGDAHLANMVLIDNQVVLFDCLEFNPALRWIDVVSELAFAVMDLEDRAHPEFARRLLDRYLQRSGDYAGLALLRFYQVYRACVRAKVAVLRWQQTPADNELQLAWREFCDYLSLAETYTHARQPIVVCCYGVSGAGKTTVSQHLLESLPLIRLRSDVERKRLFGLALEDRSDEAVGEVMYSEETSTRTFDRLATLAQTIVQAGFGVIVDATFLRQAERRRFAALAQTLETPFRILEITATEAAMRKRIEQRNHFGKDASEADASVLARQLEWREPLTPEERRITLTVSNEQGAELGEICAKLDSLMKGTG
ncbi:MAG: AAA family ATPase [Acidiferrobacterales bacterium]|nr:AAA family ATPase [Acidiferrobacterales bacterium]